MMRNSSWVRCFTLAKEAVSILYRHGIGSSRQQSKVMQTLNANTLACFTSAEDAASIL